MELDNDLKGQFETLDGEITRFKYGAIALAILAFIPFLIAFVFNFFIFNMYLTLEDFGTYVGGVSAPFGSISGILFVYVAFLGQRQQLLFNQQEIRVNRNALQDSLDEAKSQRTVIELQNKQFQIQSYETTFFNLLTHFKNSGPLDRLSQTFLFVKQKFDYIDKEYTKDPYGGLIWNVKKNSIEILESKKSFKEIIMKLEDHDSTEIYDSLNMLLSILEHINNHPEIKSNHNSTLHNILSYKEKFILFYFYLTIVENHNKAEQALLYKFFKEIDSIVYFHKSHKDWV